MLRHTAAAAAVVAAFLLPASANALECYGAFTSALDLTKADASKFSLASEFCSQQKNATESSASSSEPQPRRASSITLTEQLQLYDAADPMTSIVESRPLYLAARDAVARSPRPAPAGRNFSELVTSVAAQHNIDPDFLQAIMFVESRANPKAVSHAGARGLMQVMPATARRFGVREPLVELHDPYTNIRVAAVYLKKLQSLFGNDLRLVLAAYNAGEGAVLKYGRKIPPYRETQGYVKNVLARYQFLTGVGMGVQ